MPAHDTGIDFVHQWIPPESYPYDLETSMVGGGVAIGDYDGDDRPDVYLSRPYGGNRLYRNLGGLRFQDVTRQSGTEDTQFWGQGVTFVDIDNDGDLDLYACGHGCPNRLYVNQGDGTFREQAREYGLDFRGASVMMAFADYDNDGDLDGYLVTNHLPSPTSFDGVKAARIDGQWVVPQEAREYRDVLVEPDGTPVVIRAAQYDHLFRNDGPDPSGQVRFQDVTQQAGIDGNDHGLTAVWWDYNDDGYADLYVANDFTDPDYLYRNNGDGTFTDVLPMAVPHTPWFSMGVDVADVNNDGRFDLLATDMAGTTHYKQKVAMGEMSSRLWFLDYPTPRQYMRNALYVNTGTQRFMEAAYLAGLASTDWTWAVRFADLDNDGHADLFVTTGMTRDWQNSDWKAQVEKLGGKDSPAGRQFWLNQPPKAEANLAFRNLGDFRFQNVSALWGLDDVGVSFGAATADLDADGDLDLVVNNFNQPAAVYRNDGDRGNRLIFRLRGTRSNRFGVDARIVVRTASRVQTQHLTLARGFMSSSQPIVHFGLGDETMAESVTITWPGGRVQTLERLAANRQYTVVEPDELPALERRRAAGTPLFRESKVLALARHHEAPHDDFAQQPLLPNRLSQLGPGMAWGDVDQDGDDDLYLGGAAGQPGMLFFNRDGRFALSPDSSTPDGPFVHDQACEDMGCVFLDADGDGDLDLYCASGGVEAPANSETLRDRLYLNNGRGRFCPAPESALPAATDSAGCAVAADFDRDGDLDLFVGGRVIPGEYPAPPDSRLLRNDSSTGEVRFTDATEQQAPQLRQIGLVTGALWSDANGDGWIDLLVTEEWGPVNLLLNQQGSLIDATREAGLRDRHGWWNGIAGGDVDHDGDIDYVVTNFGLNTKYHASPDRPLVLFYGEFDNSGRKQLVEAEYEGNTLYPVRGRSCSTKAIPMLAERFQSFHEFALAPLAEIYTPSRLENSLKYEINTLESGVLINSGTGRFTFRPFPPVAQVAPAFGVALTCANDDDHLDAYLVQNFFSPQPETGRMDGGVSLLLAGDGTGNFSPVWPGTSGLVVPGDAKSLALVDTNLDGLDDFVVGVNNGPTVVFERSPPRSARFFTIRLKGNQGNGPAIGTRVTVRTRAGRERTAEIYGGNGYLSQSAPTATFALVDDAIERVTVHWPDGTTRRFTLLDGQTDPSVAESRRTHARCMTLSLGEG